MSYANSQFISGSTGNRTLTPRLWRPIPHSFILPYHTPHLPYDHHHHYFFLKVSFQNHIKKHLK